MLKMRTRFLALVTTFALFVASVSMLMIAAVGFVKKTSASEGEGGGKPTPAALEAPALLTLQYNGYDIAEFTPGEFIGTKRTENARDTALYAIELSAGTTEVPTVTATAASGLIVDIANATALPGRTIITVGDGTDMNNSYYWLDFTVASEPEGTVYYENFNTSKSLNWTAVNNSNGTYPTDSVERTDSGELKLTSAAGGNHCFFDNATTFTTVNAVYHAKIRFTTVIAGAAPGPRIGLMVRGVDGSNHGTLAYDGVTKFGWHAHKSNASAANNDGVYNQFELKANVVYDWKVQIENDTVKLRINNKLLFTYTIPNTSQHPAFASGTYKFGIRLWFAPQEVYLDDLYVSSQLEADPIPPSFETDKEDAMPEDGTYETIQSEDMKVYVGNDFPFVYKYMNERGAFLANGVAPEEAAYRKKMTINDRNIKVSSSQISKSNDEVVYKIIAHNSGDPENLIDSEFTVRLYVTAGKKLRIEFTDIVEKNGTVVKSFYIPNHSMVSFRGDDAQLAISEYTDWGPMKDTFLNLSDVTSTAGSALATHVLLSSTDVSAAMESNSVDGKRKFDARSEVSEEVSEMNTITRRFALSANKWAYHYYGKNTPIIPGYETPYAEVILGGDENKNGTVNWQDAALLERRIMKMPFGGENTKDYWTYIAMNISSQVANPSNRILDRAKAISYVTDGFGQKVMNKGYQVGGHDDSHGDYDNVSYQQGGAAGFEHLSKVGEKYNVQTGIHINATEYPLDGFDTVLANMTNPLSINWNWGDQGYLVDKVKDLTSGEIERRVSQLQQALPSLDWVYVDVWQSGSDYTAKALAYYLNNAGYSVATEAAGDFIGDTLFHHWNTDLYYGIGGTQSQIIRFIENDIADKFAPDKALLSMTMPGVAEWRNVSQFNDAERVFYRNNLAAKYMQYFELLEWTKDTSAKFSGGVESRVDADGIMTLKKDNKIIAKINVSNFQTEFSNSSKPNPQRTTSAEIFIPWSPITEEKIYYYNDNHDSSVWELPTSWSNVTTCYQYELTEQGRVYIGEVTPSDGSVTIAGTKSTPYIITKEKQETGGLGVNRLPAAKGTWGEGSAISNFGFTGSDMEGWSATAGVEWVQDYNDTAYVNYGDAFVRFNSEGTLNQTLTLEPNSTYSISAWVLTQNREVKLSATVGDREFSRTISNTAVPVKAKPSKYEKKNFERMEITFDTGDNTTVQLTLTVGAGDGLCFVDDFREFKWMTARTDQPKGYYLVKEDFENVDEGWGPFVSQVSSQPYIHLAQVDTSEECRQIKNYVIDGEWSLKDQQREAGIHMRTLPSTLKFEAGTTYRITFDYQAYREYRHNKDQNLGSYKDRGETGVAVYSPEANGYNVPLERDDLYMFTVRYADGRILKQTNLKASKFASAGYTYNSKPSIEKYELVVDGADVQEGMYLTLDKATGKTWVDGTYKDITSIFTMDNFEVMSIEGTVVSYEQPEQVTRKFNTPLGFENQITVATQENETVALPVEYQGYNEKLVGEQTVIGTIDYQNYLLGADFNTQFEVKVTVLNQALGYTKPIISTVVDYNTDPVLPESVDVKFADGDTRACKIQYEGFDKTRPGRQEITATLNMGDYDLAPDFAQTFTVYVHVNEQPNKVVSVAIPQISITIAPGTQPTLPNTVEALLANGSKVMCGVTYTGFDSSVKGEQTITATIDTGDYVFDSSVGTTFEVKVSVVESGNEQPNKVVSVAIPQISITIAPGTQPTLPNTVEVLLASGSKVMCGVTYTGFDSSVKGEQTITATIDTGDYVFDSSVATTFEVKVNVAESGVDRSVALGLGLGLGIPLVVVFAGAGVFLFLFRKKLFGKQ